MPNLLDLMSAEDRQTMKKWAAEKRDSKYKRDIPPELYLAGQLGHYYGWQAVVDYMRGYMEGVDEDGRHTKLAFSFEQAVALVKAAEKVRYRIILDEGRIYAANSISVYDKKFAKSNTEYVNNIATKVNQ